MDDSHMDSFEGYEDDHTDANPMEPEDVNHTSVGNTSTSTERWSEAWKHMKLVGEIRGGEKVCLAICNYCNRELFASTAIGTGHLNRHWKRCWEKVAAATRIAGQPIQTQLTFAPDSSVSTWIFDP